MLESDALANLSLAARRCLDRLMIEHMQHAGKENGNLRCTYTDFEKFGVRRASVAEAIREIEAAGLVVVEERGRGGNREYRKPSIYRLTWLPANGMEPTDEWKRALPHTEI